MKVIKIINHVGIPFNVLIRKTYGIKKVSFYDERFEHSKYGQHIATYYANTIAKHHNKLFLDLGIKNWQVSYDNIKEIQKNL